MKNCKTFYESQTASHLQEIIQRSPNPTPSDKMLLRLSKKKFLYTYIQIYTEIYRHLLSKYFKNGDLGRQEMVQCKCFL